MNRLRSWPQILLCELPDYFNSVEGTQARGIIAPELIIHALIREGKLCQRPLRLAYTEYCAITPIKRPQSQAPKATVSIELLNNECCRLGLMALYRRFSQFSVTLMAPSERERFTLVCFHALLEGDVDLVFRQSVSTLSAFIPNYLIQLRPCNG